MYTCPHDGNRNGSYISAKLKPRPDPTRVKGSFLNSTRLSECRSPNCSSMGRRLLTIACRFRVLLAESPPRIVLGEHSKSEVAPKLEAARFGHRANNKAI